MQRCGLVLLIRLSNSKRMENNSKKNIGILFPPRKGNGGIFQYAMSIAEALANYCEDFTYTVFYFNESPEKDLKLNNKGNIKFVELENREETLLTKLAIAQGIITKRPLFNVGAKNKEILKKENVDLLIMASPLQAGFELDTPFILPILDMMYQNYHLYFPEYSSTKTRLITQAVLKYLSDKSVLLLGESEWEKNDIIKFLDQPKEKVDYILLIPPGYVYEYKDMAKEEAETLLKKYNLPEKYLFYPAQFFPHKNHLRLIESLRQLKEKHQEKVNLVLSGNPKTNPENYQKIKDLIAKHKLEDQVFFLGYVEDKEMVALYKKAVAIVFPTFAGPTNIPPLEGMLLGTPVLISDLFDMPKQVGDAGIVFDPRSVDDMVEKIVKVWKNEPLRNQMIEKGFKQVQNLNFENYAKEWVRVVKKALSNI